MSAPPGAPDHEIYPDEAGRRRAIVSWCLFDFANSSYTTLIITVAFAVYFRDVVLGPGDSRGDLFWALSNNIAMIVVAVASPIVGAVADYSGRKKFFFVLTALQTVVFTALLFTAGPGDLFTAMALYVLATIGFEGGYVFYNAFLPEIARREAIGRVSGWAWAVGFLGGLSALGLCYPWLASELRAADGALNFSAVRDRQFVFLLVAGFYLVFSLPAFAWIRESPPQGQVQRRSEYVAIGFRRVLQTIRHLRSYRETGKYVLASLFFNDGITTIIIFSAPYATETFGFTSAEVAIMFLVLNVVAFPGALVAGYLADAFGARRTLLASLWLWIAVVLTGFLAPDKATFWIMACGAAIGMGSTQAVARSFMAQISPADRESEFFGFYVLSGKFASIFGPLIFGVISTVTGSQRIAVLSLLPLFLIGLLLMFSVDEKAALRAAGR